MAMGCRVEGVKTVFCAYMCEVRKCCISKGYETCALNLFPYRNLDYGKPIFRVFLVPYSFYIAGTRGIRDGVAHF